MVKNSKDARSPLLPINYWVFCVSPTPQKIPARRPAPHNVYLTRRGRACTFPVMPLFSLDLQKVGQRTTSQPPFPLARSCLRRLEPGQSSLAAPKRSRGGWGESALPAPLRLRAQSNPAESRRMPRPRSRRKEPPTGLASLPPLCGALARQPDWAAATTQVTS